MRKVSKLVVDYVLGLVNCLTAGEASADEGEGEQSLADLGILGGGGLGEVGQDPAAHGDGLLDLLEADRVLRQARGGQQPRHGAEPDHQVVVGGLELDAVLDRQSARQNSSHVASSCAVLCLTTTASEH